MSIIYARELEEYLAGFEPFKVDASSDGKIIVRFGRVGIFSRTALEQMLPDLQDNLPMATQLIFDFDGEQILTVNWDTKPYIYI